MTKNKCTGVILNFGSAGIEGVRRNLFNALAQMELEKYPSGYKLNANEIASRAYEKCEFKDFDDENGFYTIK